MQRLRLVTLACRAGEDEVPDHTAVMLDEELGAEALERLLYALMCRCMSQLEDVVEDGRRGGHEHVTFEEDEAVLHPPLGAVRASRNGVPAGT